MLEPGEDWIEVDVSADSGGFEFADRDCGLCKAVGVPNLQNAAASGFLGYLNVHLAWRDIEKRDIAIVELDSYTAQLQRQQRTGSGLRLDGQILSEDTRDRAGRE